MHNLDKINEAILNLEKAERARVLYQVLVECLGLNPKETTFKEVIATIQHYINQENEAIRIMADIQRITKENVEAEETAVS